MSRNKFHLEFSLQALAQSPHHPCHLELWFFPSKKFWDKPGPHNHLALDSFSHQKFKVFSAHRFLSMTFIVSQMSLDINKREESYGHKSTLCSLFNPLTAPGQLPDWAKGHSLWLTYLLCCRFWWDSQQLNVSAVASCIKANTLIVGLKEVTSRNRLYTACKDSKFLQVMPKINFLSLSFLLCDLTDWIFPSQKKSLWGKSCGPLLFHPHLVTFLLLIYCQCF